VRDVEVQAVSHVTHVVAVVLSFLRCVISSEMKRYVR
jgi:hypothetical protein